MLKIIHCIHTCSVNKIASTWHSTRRKQSSSRKGNLTKLFKFSLTKCSKTLHCLSTCTSTWWTRERLFNLLSFDLPYERKCGLKWDVGGSSSHFSINPSRVPITKRACSSVVEQLNNWGQILGLIPSMFKILTGNALNMMTSMP